MLMTCMNTRVHAIFHYRSEHYLVDIIMLEVLEQMDILVIVTEDSC